MAPDSFPWGAGGVACSWERTPVAAAEQCRGGCGCLLEAHGSCRHACASGVHSGRLLLFSFTRLGRGCLRGEGWPRRGAGRTGAQLQPTGPSPRSPWPDAGAAARCHLGLGAVGAQPQWSQGHSGGTGPGRPCGIQGGARGSPGWQACSRGKRPRPALCRFLGARRCPRAGGISSGRQAGTSCHVAALCVSCDNCMGALPSPPRPSQSLSALFPDVFGGFAAVKCLCKLSCRLAADGLEAARGLPAWPAALA